ncbi:pseudouridine synthase [Colwellia sp. 4_MG-2023]|jgi:tRNA pseudouridine65 synthase|uniref:pseudouridine synthase n=1 Tax=unclassified Colwellia TaxID=196834 RepID=UPI001C08F8CF|nr:MULTISPECIES: pseudouridine synthase [unclassified Colwellia]MBU2923924.1 tRNA pseudouridine(65) synthase TruC [Colwellia sp. C2M11]MDO6488852.1 pseudouridine synthase [Colwellia sp. 6_MG-2023]MDO6507616.1 pseudouridine synthase [Colwellia sp. 5_MG-2023]MDO6555612.1 pseudouridine synthase [Colwellia sp. 4_MG-2023]MDO6653005.1 pseudouridine synthase [Colwellia sp. 3_MG-2023]
MPLQLNKPISEISDQKPVLTILYQDEYLIAVDKPAGLFVHRSFMDKNEIYFALQLVRDQIGKYVYPVHRLDRPTSGVLLFALTQEVAQKMNEAFASKSNEVNIRENSTQEAYTNTELTKTYFALVRGHLAMFEHDTLIDHALKEKLDKIGDKNVRRDKPAQLAQTNYRVIKQASLPISLGKFDSVRYSLVRLTPITGRRHQIRRHLAHLRHPIIGDINYGDNKQNPFFTNHFGFKRLMLIAKSLSFLHPITHEKVIINAAFDQQWQYLFNTLDWSDDIS